MTADAADARVPSTKGRVTHARAVLECMPELAQPLDATGLIGPPSPRDRIDLKSLAQVRREMARVYRDVRAGQLGSSDGARLVFMLGQIGKMIELSEVEVRLARLEDQAWAPSKVA